MRHLVYTWDKRAKTENPYVGDFTKYLCIISFTPVLVFSMIGFVVSLYIGKRIFLIVAPILSFWLGYSIFFTQIRYRIPIEPFLIILAAFGLVSLLGWLFRERNVLINELTCNNGAALKQ